MIHGGQQEFREEASGCKVKRRVAKWKQIFSAEFSVFIYYLVYYTILPMNIILLTNKPFTDTHNKSYLVHNQFILMIISQESDIYYLYKNAVTADIMSMHIKLKYYNIVL